MAKINFAPVIIKILSYTDGLDLWDAKSTKNRVWKIPQPHSSLRALNMSVFCGFLNIKNRKITQKYPLQRRLKNDVVPLFGSGTFFGKTKIYKVLINQSFINTLFFARFSHFFRISTGLINICDNCSEIFSIIHWNLGATSPGLVCIFTVSEHISCA